MLGSIQCLMLKCHDHPLHCVTKSLYLLSVSLECYLFLFIMKFVQLGTQIKTRCEKKQIYKNTQKVHYEVHKNHIIKSTSDSQNSEI